MSGNMNEYATVESNYSKVAKIALVGLVIVAAIVLIIVIWVKSTAEGYRIREFGQRGITSTVSGVPNPALGSMN